MREHMKRVVEEKAQLDERISRLTSFIDDANKREELFVPAPELVRLMSQLHHMVSYAAILGERIRVEQADHDSQPE